MKSQIMEMITQIPYGHTTSYGYVAELLDQQCGIKTSGWMVGKILSGMNAEEQLRYPWRRVVRKDGYISAIKLGERGLRQIVLLEKEKISVVNEVVNMTEYSRKKQA